MEIIGTIIFVGLTFLYVKNVFKKGSDQGIKLLAESFILTALLMLIFFFAQIVGDNILGIIKTNFSYSPLWVLDYMATCIWASVVLTKFLSFSFIKTETE